MSSQFFFPFFSPSMLAVILGIDICIKPCFADPANRLIIIFTLSIWIDRTDQTV